MTRALFRFWLSGVLFVGCLQIAWTQDKPPGERSATSTNLSLMDVVNLARQRNGTIAAAYYDYLAATQRTVGAYAQFLPTVTPSYVYTSNRQQFTGNSLSPGGFQQTEGGTTQVVASWHILDLGEREFNFLAFRRAEDSQFFTARQTLRQTLFNVQQQFIETLRSSELQKVADAQVSRASTILEQTKAAVEVGTTAKKDILQAQADLSNAQVAQIVSRNSTSTNGAALKSLIGYPSDQALPALTQLPDPDLLMVPKNLKQALDEGIRDRTDLIALRKNLEALHYDEKVLDRQAGVSLSLDASFAEAYSPDHQESRFGSLTLTYPLFDGGRSRAAARAAGYNVKAARQNLLQSERAARSEIEAAFVELTQDVERLAAAKSAVAAASENYNVAVDSQKVGTSTIIDVLTAQVSLVTAESNLIQATYDFDIAEIRYRLATGKALAGEPPANRFGDVISNK